MPKLAAAHGKLQEVNETAGQSYQGGRKTALRAGQRKLGHRPVFQLIRGYTQMAAFTLTAANPSSGLAGNLIAGYLGHDGGPSRIFTSATTITNASSAASSGSPTLTSITQVTATDGAFPSNGGPQGGPWVMKLTPATTDTVNASSPMSRIYVSPNAFIVSISA